VSPVLAPPSESQSCQVWPKKPLVAARRDPLLGLQAKQAQVTAKHGGATGEAWRGATE